MLESIWLYPLLFLTAFVVVMGFSLTEATGYTKTMNFTSNIVIKIGAVMAAGQIHR
jgi:hypothetical protein